MNTVLCLKSAWEYWHVARVTDDPQLRADPVARRKPLSFARSRTVLLDERAPDAETLRAIQCGFARFEPLRLSDGLHDVAGLTLPLHVLVARGPAGRLAGGHVVHQASVPLPPFSLVFPENGLAISSPEHLYLQAATKLGRLELVWLASEMCSLFSFHPSGEGGLMPALPLTTVKKLAGYLDGARELGTRGIRRAQAALPYVVEGAASRREIACALRMALPRAWGGRGIPKPVLNFGLPIDRRCASVHGWDRVSVDIAWPEQRLAVEYDSDAFHLDSRRRARDNDKRSALEQMGWRIVPFSTKQFDSIAMSDDAFRRIGAALGVKNRAGESRYDWQARRSELTLALWRLCERGVEL